MVDSDILEIELNTLKVTKNGIGGGASNALLTFSWLYPRENVQSIQAVVPVEKLTDNFEVDIGGASYSDKLVFKETRRGNSALIAELAVVQDPGLISGLIEGVLSIGLGTITNPFMGLGLNALVKELKLDEKKVQVIGKGSVQIAAGVNQGSLSIPLKIPKQVVYYDDSIEEDSDEPIDPIVLPAGEPNGSVGLILKQLSAS